MKRGRKKRKEKKEYVAVAGEDFLGGAPPLIAGIRNLRSIDYVTPSLYVDSYTNNLLDLYLTPSYLPASVITFCAASSNPSNACRGSPLSAIYPVSADRIQSE
jgi:hypothetical protein